MVDIIVFFLWELVAISFLIIISIEDPANGVLYVLKEEKNP